MSYSKQNFQAGDTLTATQLNHIENGVEALDIEQSSLSANIDNINIAIGQVKNQLDSCATEEYVINKIAEAELSGSEVDLSGYAQKSDIPTKTSQLENDSTYVRRSELYSNAYLTTGNGSQYSVEIPNLGQISNGTTIMIIPHVTSTNTIPTLNVNRLGAKNIFRYVSATTQTIYSGNAADWLMANRPIELIFNGENWIVSNLTKPLANDIEGTLSITHGGTGNISGYIRTGAYSNSTIGKKATAEGFNNLAPGNYSHAEGYYVQAEGEASHAEGYNTNAQAYASHAEGFKTTASGQGTHAEGQETTASGGSSHAEGNATVASGNQAHAEGYKTTASGGTSHAEGYGTTASNYYAHAEGNDTTASGEESHAEGYQTVALGETSHAEGYSSILLPNTITAASTIDEIIEAWESSDGFLLAFGEGSHAEGRDTLALGGDSHAEGYNTVASGEESHAEGRDTIASGTNQHVQGRFNVEDTTDKYAHIVGNGDSTTRSNAHTLDWDGNAWFAGAINCEDVVTTLDNLGALNLAHVPDDDTDHLIPENADLNDYITPGAYRCATSAIAKTLSNMTSYTSAGFRLIVSGTSTGNGSVQFIIFNSGVGRLWFRIRTGIDTWGDWRHIITDGNILDTVYPVGSIYLSVESTSPASLFGGTWTQLKDRFLLGAGSSYTAGNTSGSKSTTLKEANLPAHTHGLRSTTISVGSTGAIKDIIVPHTSGSSSESYITSTGSATSFTNMPPYLVVYMWKRTE